MLSHGTPEPIISSFLHALALLLLLDEDFRGCQLGKTRPLEFTPPCGGDTGVVASPDFLTSEASSFVAGLLNTSDSLVIAVILSIKSTLEACALPYTEEFGSKCSSIGVLVSSLIFSREVSTCLAEIKSKLSTCFV